MKVLRFLPRSIAVILLVLLGLLLIAAAYPFLGMGGRQALNQAWSRCLLRVCGIQLSVRGDPLMEGGVLLVANHVSWIDIFVINAVRPTAFVAKSEIRKWPIIGWLVAGAGTVFLQRGQRHAIQAAGEAMKLRFAAGESVGLFPEGTTSEGFSLLPFHGSLFEPARQAEVAIQPMVLRFLRNGKRDSFASFVGEETLVANLWRVICTKGLAVETVYLPPLSLQGADGAPASRSELAARARKAIAAHLD